MTEFSFSKIHFGCNMENMESETEVIDHLEGFGEK